MADETSAIGGAIPAAEPAAASPIACGGTRGVGPHIIETIRSSLIPPSREVHYETQVQELLEAPESHVIH